MLKNNPLVSVIVPTYNRDHIIIDALKSIFNQTYRPLEIIVIDDGSTDNTKSVVQNWAQAYRNENTLSVRYIHQTNQGGNPARNHGIKEASGKFIAFLDSDDLWHANKLEKQMAVMQSASDIGGVYCGLRHVFLESGVIQPPSPRKYPDGDLLHKILIHDVTAPTSTYLIRAEAFEKVGSFDKDLLARQDWDMWIRLATQYKIGVVPEVLVDYREHEGVRTASNPQKEINAYKAIMGKYAHLRSQCPIAVRQASKASFYRRMGRVYFHQKISNSQAFGYLVCSILNWPFVFDSYTALFGMLLPKQFRGYLHMTWNRYLGSTGLAIKSH